MGGSVQSWYKENNVCEKRMLFLSPLRKQGVYDEVEVDSRFRGNDIFIEELMLFTNQE